MVSPLPSLLLFLGGFAQGAPLSLEGVPDPRARGSWVADTAEVISPEAEARIDARVDALYQSLEAEIAVVTAQEVPGSPKDFATALLNRWGVGSAAANHGILVLLVVGERRVEVEVGYGVEGLLPDARVGAILDRAAVPAFRAGDYGAGLAATVEEIAAVLEAHPEETRSGTGTVMAIGGGALPHDRASLPPSEERLATGAAVAASGGAVTLLAVGGLAWRRRRRRCPICKEQMTLLSEEADDAHLDAGQRTEESLRSIDYEVRVCAEHDQVRIFRHRKLFGGRVGCPSCKYVTASRSSRTLQAATTAHGGTVEVTVTCAHCGHHSTRTHITPRIRPPSSGGGGHHSSGSSGRSSSSRHSSGRSGGSFGGGRSGGGGAGRSW